MKSFVFSLLLFTGSALAQVDNTDLWRLRGKLQGRDFGLETALIDRVLEESKASAKKDLKEAKFFLINGETALARNSLNKLIKHDQHNLRPYLFRFLGIAAFQDGKWKEALKEFSRPELNTFPHYAAICPLKVVLRVATQDIRGLRSEWGRCKVENSKDFVSREMIWMDVLVQLATKTPFEDVAQVAKRFNPLNLNNNDLRIALKISLYLNIDHYMLDSLERLDYSVIRDEELRELIAQIYFRHGRLADAWRMMEDLSSPNVENMKGNIWLLRGKPEIAFAHFKLALVQKTNSHNAVERALPLAWLLKQWTDGSVLAERIFSHEKNIDQKLTTMAAFAVANQAWEPAQAHLEKVHQRSGDATAHEVMQLSTYVALRLNDEKRLTDYSKLTCEGGDLVACWLVNSKFIWPELPRLINNEDALDPVEPLWRSLAATKAEPFKDEAFIDQRDIDELDDSLIKLVK